MRTQRAVVGVASGSRPRRARPYRVALLGLAAVAAVAAMLVSVGSAAAEQPPGPTSNRVPPPTGLAVTATTTSLKLTWIPVTVATGYALYLDGPFAGTTESTSWTFQESSVRNDSLRPGDHTLLRTRVDEGGAHGVDQSLSASASAPASAATPAPATPASAATRDESLRYDVGGVVDRHGVGRPEGSFAV